jgi:hypothetical protein
VSERQEPPLRAPVAPEPVRASLRAERSGGEPAQPRTRAGLRRAVFLVVGALVLIIGLWDVSGRGVINPAVPPAVEAAQDIALVTTSVYVALRTINAALSAAQEVEIGASIGAQASLQPLKVLEPVDDTVERVAAVVFSVAAGAAVAVVGLEPVAAIGLVVLGIGLLGMGLGTGSVAAAGLRAVRLDAALGLVLPLVFAGGIWLGERATASQWEEAMAQLNAVTSEASVLIGGGEEELLAEAAESGGLFSGFIGALTDATSSVQNYIEAAGVFTQQADALFAATLTIIGIFVLRTLVLPALLLWSVMAVLRKSVG